jgi:hypothetical protein
VQGSAPQPMSWGERNGFRSEGAAGRWPANVVLDPEAAALLGDTGGASRFYYTAKASRREREAGLEGMPEGTALDMWTAE